jgi:hypothetical protein
MARSDCSEMCGGRDDVERAVDGLDAAGASMERHAPSKGHNQDTKGIMRDNGPTIAWLKDPAGNIPSVIENGPR